MSQPMTTIILFKRKGKSYRMRLPCTHMHPGDIDGFEVANKDVLGQTSWSRVPASCADIPSGEWLVRRALWYLIEGNNQPITRMSEGLVSIDLGELEI